MPVTFRHPQYVERVADWEDCRHFHQGERVVKSLGRRYLPKPEGATEAEYQSYVRRAFFFGALERTVAGLAGAIDRKPPLTTLPPELEYLKTNADGRGSSLRRLSRALLDELLITGRAGLLVDRDEDGGRPYLALYRAEDIINWREDEGRRLTLAVLAENASEPGADDPFSLVLKKRYRVLSIEEGQYQQQLYEADSFRDQPAPAGPPVVPARFGRPLASLPFVFAGVRGLSPDVEKPPLLDLVFKNAEHFRVSADYANALYFTGNPLLYLKGVKRPARRPGDGPDPDPNAPALRLALGSTRAVHLPDAAAEIGLVECRGHGVNPNRDKANDCLREMAVLGARLLENQRSGVEAAETALLRQSGETSTLSAIVTNAGAAIRHALEIVADWEGVPAEGLHFALNNDFIDITLNHQLLSALADLVERDLMSWPTFYHNLTLGELTRPEVNADQERETIEQGPPRAAPRPAPAAPEA